MPIKQAASFSLTTIPIGSAHRELANITHISTAMAIVSDNSTPNSDINMVFDPDNNIYDIGEGFKEGRGHSLSSSIHKPRFPSISSSECSEDYHICIQRRSDKMDEDKPANSIGSINVEYTSQGEQKDQVSKVNDHINNTSQQHVSNEVPISSTTSSNNMFDIQLSYDVNQALDPKEWDGDFHTTLLHRAMEHLASNVKNIKDSLQRMGIYLR